ncbi:TetR family transcriptional regulator [Azotobacter chroococcum]|uniref:Transcriptional regulator, TetR family n=1 Tax=Azotobacter chroococcum NCIMB 8003 TaxID=1328314 RepID=A0A0C4WIP2_9GAMM|nr:TetR family transcriptional regulator [Azotobacter chroococcum]AJE19599.1 Transcriptional regulator, TetR family [Azotobacter chroococcum NCIMB 8003]
MTGSAQILDTALQIAERSGWERLRLFDVAATLGIGLDEVARRYRDKDALVEAWFDRADAAMLARARDAGLAVLTPAGRLEELLVVWLAALAPHRRLTAEMLCYKLEPGHVHLQALGLMRISRTVQWWREAAGRTNSHLSRIGEECALSTVYLCTFSHWLRHYREDEAALRAYLRRRLYSLPLAWLLRP